MLKRTIIITSGGKVGIHKIHTEFELLFCDFQNKLSSSLSVLVLYVTCKSHIYTQTKVKQHQIFSETLFWKLQNGICE